MIGRPVHPRPISYPCACGLCGGCVGVVIGILIALVGR